MTLRSTVGLFVILVCAGSAGAQEPAPRARLDVTVADAPYNFAHGGRAPSMQQSLDATVATYELVHYGFGKVFGKHRKLNSSATFLFDFLTGTGTVALPLTQGWLHEEFHRAQMGRRGIGSFNDVYRFQFGGDAIYVSHVRDEDIVALKASHPAEWVRVGSAGIEGELLLAREMEIRSFRGQAMGTSVITAWMSKYAATWYVASSVASWGDAETDQLNTADGADIPRRDFTGHDLLAWVYDLHRPSEPYDARGVHPSGVGIDRYRKLSHLTPEERRYIQRQKDLTLLNYVDPFLVGFRGVTLRNGVKATASLSHYLTSHGYAIDANVLAMNARGATSVIARAYVNAERTLPGVEATLYDRRARVAGRAVDLTPRVALWLQPKGQQFRTRDVSAGGLAALRVRSVSNARVQSFIDLEAKTAGWVAGNPYLDAGVSLRTGVTVTARR